MNKRDIPFGVVEDPIEIDIGYNSGIEPYGNTFGEASDFNYDPELFSPPIEVEVGFGVNVKDHTSLSGRDEPNQHPMSAITGLEDALDDMVSEDEMVEFSNQEVIALWNLIE